MDRKSNVKPLSEAIAKAIGGDGSSSLQTVVKQETKENIRRYEVCQQHLVQANKGIRNLH